LQVVREVVGVGALQAQGWEERVLGQLQLGWVGVRMKGMVVQD
jgi:hypothetical protein